MNGALNVPQSLEAMFRDIRTFEASYIIGQLVENYATVLVIGDEWGREYYTLTSSGHNVFNIDIAWQPHLPRFAVADATRRLPFPDQTFDAVVLAEVLEHLFEDSSALTEVRRVLKDTGRLVVSVPFFNDAPEYHVRIHSDRTIQRLLAHAGFTVSQFIYRGGWISFPRFIGLLARLFGRARILGIFADWDFRLGCQGDIWMRRSQYYGAYVFATKGSYTDFRSLNANEFSLMASMSRILPSSK